MFFVNTWLQKMIHVWACLVSCFQIRLSLNGHVGYALVEVIKKGLNLHKNIILTKNIIQYNKNCELPEQCELIVVPALASDWSMTSSSFDHCAAHVADRYFVVVQKPSVISGII